MDPEMTLSHYDIFNDNDIPVGVLEKGDVLLQGRIPENLDESDREKADNVLVELTLTEVTRRDPASTSLWILRVGDYGSDWHTAKNLYDHGVESGEFAPLLKEMEQMESQESNPNNYNFFANGILVHNK